jgi:hypothetical protein
MNTPCEMEGLQHHQTGAFLVFRTKRNGEYLHPAYYIAKKDLTYPKFPYRWVGDSLPLKMDE